eukprot:3934287-Rhodomonas_salina.1
MRATSERLAMRATSARQTVGAMSGCKWSQSRHWLVMRAMSGRLGMRATSARQPAGAMSGCKWTQSRHWLVMRATSERPTTTIGPTMKSSNQHGIHNLTTTSHQIKELGDICIRVTNDDHFIGADVISAYSSGNYKTRDAARVVANVKNGKKKEHRERIEVIYKRRALVRGSDGRVRNTTIVTMDEALELLDIIPNTFTWT